MILPPIKKGKFECKFSISSMKFYIFFILTIFLLACKTKNDKKPDVLVSKEKMVNILTDMHRMEGFVNNLGIQSSDTTQFFFRKLEAEIFKKYAVDTAAYYQSYKYYLINPEDFKEIYSDVVKQITAKNKIDSLAESKLKKVVVDTTKKDTVKLIKPKIFGKKNLFMDSLRIKFKNAKK
jgi:Domain of unknown function (DUF4296)